MAVDEVKNLPVRAGECVKRRPDPAIADGVSIGERQLKGRVVTRVLVSGVKESESLGEISGLIGRRRGPGLGPGLMAAQAFPPAEREQPGAHPAVVLQASGKGVPGDKGDLSGARSPGPVAEQAAAVVEQVPRMMVEHLGEGVLIA